MNHITPMLETVLELSLPRWHHETIVTEASIGRWSETGGLFQEVYDCGWLALQSQLPHVSEGGVEFNRTPSLQGPATAHVTDVTVTHTFLPISLTPSCDWKKKIHWKRWNVWMAQLTGRGAGRFMVCHHGSLTSGLSSGHGWLHIRFLSFVFIHHCCFC